MLSAAEFLLHQDGRLKRPIEQRYYISQRECNASRRCVLINWMSEVIVYHGMHRETFHLAVSILDRFVEQRDIPKQRLQLYGATCILIAGKLKEIYPPDVPDYCSLCDWKYTKSEMCDAELDILFALEWQLNDLTANDYFGIFVTKLLADIPKNSLLEDACCEIYEKGCRLLDIAVHHPLSLCYTESELALNIYAHYLSAVFPDIQLEFGPSDACQAWISAMERCPGMIGVSQPKGLVDSHTLTVSNEKSLAYVLSQINTEK